VDRNKETKREDVFYVKGAKTDSVSLTSEDSSSQQDMKFSRKRKYEPAFTLNHFSSDDSSDKEINDNSVISLKQTDNESLNSDKNEDDSDFGINEVVDSDASGVSDEEGLEESAVRWKANLAQKAADAFLERQSTTHNLWKLVYGKCNDCILFT